MEKNHIYSINGTMTMDNYSNLFIFLLCSSILVSSLNIQVDSVELILERNYIDWIPIKDTRVFDEKIDIGGSLVIKDGICLSIFNCDIIFDINEEKGGGILNEKGGSFFLRNSTISVTGSFSPYFINHGYVEISDSVFTNLSSGEDINNVGLETIDGITKIIGSSITNCIGNALFFERSIFSVVGSKIFNNTRNGIFINDSSGSIDSCELFGNAYQAITVFNSNVSLISNYIHDHKRSWNEGIGIQLQDSSGYIAYNTLKNNDMNIVCSRSKTTIENNSIYGGYYGIQVNNMVGSDNNADSPSQVEDEEYPSIGFICKNLVENCFFFGIQVFESDYEVISNVVKHVHYGSGISVRNSSPLIKDNHVESSRGGEWYIDFHLSNYCRSTLLNNTCRSISVYHYSDIEVINSGKPNGINVESYSSAVYKTFFSCLVIDDNGFPVKDASVQAIPNGSDKSFEYTTDENGRIANKLMTLYKIIAYDYADYIVQSYDQSIISFYAYKKGIGSNISNIDMNEKKEVLLVLNKSVKNEPFFNIELFRPLSNLSINVNESIKFLVFPSNNNIKYCYRWLINSYVIDNIEGEFTFITNSSSPGHYRICVQVSNDIMVREKIWYIQVIDPDLEPPFVGDDIDRDFMNDDWEKFYFGDTDEVQWGDYDNDGYTNYEEYKNDWSPTNPFNPNQQPKKNGIYIMIPIFLLIILILSIFGLIFFVIKNFKKRYHYL